MDSPAYLMTAWLALASAAISTGPNLVAVASRALGSGRRSALVVAAGVASGAFMWSFLTAVGLGTLFSLYPVLLRILGVLGGGYLFWLGIKSWRAALTGNGAQINAVIRQRTFWLAICPRLDGAIVCGAVHDMTTKTKCAVFCPH